ncbi:MAG TPA: ABC transporter substrate-binding protein, partial [Nitriliruptorales bacterium]|nr:ABC transporter substrate-binding protein [Nitriliruptorales bacterium]
PGGPDATPVGSVWTFHLRTGATFHDGRPVTAADFVRGWQRIVRAGPAGAAAAFYLLEPVKGFTQAQGGGDLVGVTAVDDRTLRVELTAPFADFPAVVSHPALGPVPAEALDDPEGFGRQPIGNGPFRISEPWRSDESQGIRLEAWDSYWGEGAEIDHLVFRIYRGEAATADGFADFVEGKLDLAPIPDGRVDEAMSAYGASEDGYTGPGVLDGVELISAFYGFNTRRPPFDDPDVRRGLSLLIDRHAIVEEVLPAGRAVARSLVPPGIAGYRPAACRFCDHDPGQAVQLLAGRGIGPERPVELVLHDGADHGAVAERVRRDVDAALGAGTVQLQALPQSQWLEAIRSGTAGFFLSGWLAEYPSPDAFLHRLFHPARIGSDNLTMYDNPEVAALLERARGELDGDVRSDLYRQAESRVLDDVAVAPLFFYRHARVVAQRVRGFRLDPMGGVDMTEVRLTSVD